MVVTTSGYTADACGNFYFSAQCVSPNRILAATIGTKVMFTFPMRLKTLCVSRALREECLTPKMPMLASIHIFNNENVGAI